MEVKKTFKITVNVSRTSLRVMPRRGSNFGTVSKAGKLFADSSTAFVDADGVMSYGDAAATARKMVRFALRAPFASGSG
jgi:hypothetical protein